MNIINRFKMLSFFLVAAYLLAACGGTLPGSAISAKGPKVEADVVAFTGIVNAINGTEWTVNGQNFILGPQASLDPNIVVGDEVRVEANVSADGAVIAMKVESSKNDDILLTPSVDASSTPEPVSTASPVASASPEASSTPDPSSNQAAGVNENEVFGTVQALTANTVTINGVAYSLANFTEFKDTISVGDQVKLHVMVNADGTFTVREIEKSLGFADDNSLSDDHSNSNGSDDGPNHDLNDDHSNLSSIDGSHSGSDDHGNDSGSDDHGGGDNSGSGSD